MPWRRITLKDNAGATPIQLAIKNGHREITQLLEQAQLRDRFLQIMIIIARDSIKQKSSWFAKLPKESLLNIMAYLNFAEMGKTNEQGLACANFILTNIDEINALIQQKHRVMIIEKLDYTAQGSPHFRFFNSLSVLTQRSEAEALKPDSDNSMLTPKAEL